MGSWWNLASDFAIILILIAGIWQFRSPRNAKGGNLAAAFAVFLALVLVIYRNGVLDPGTVVIILLVGSAVGWLVAVRVNMIQIPAMIAFQHGAGGVAAFLVSAVELTRASVTLTTVGMISGILAILLGAATFSGSMVASAKLSNRMRSTPVVLPRHNLVLLGIAALAAAVAVALGNAGEGWVAALTIAAIVVAIVLGIVFSIRIGGADMPVLISFLNATAGLAAALCGMVIESTLLIACGATVAASGSVLTHVMCKAMNRGLANVFVGFSPMVDLAQEAGDEASGVGAHRDGAMSDETRDPFDLTLDALRGARNVIIVPGLGMAMAQAQFDLVALGERLEAMGAEVRFAIHPVAGRMPGHMHVLLGEAEVDYAKVFDLKDINGDFSQTDVALVVGACDVVNPAAITKPGTPISGMDILKAYEAKCVVVCNLDNEPGYSGVANALYANPNAILLFDDAKATIGRIRQHLG